MGKQSVSPDTIFALSSGHLPAGVAVIRLSGPDVRSVLQAIAGTVPPVRRVMLRKICDGQRRVLDQGLVLYFEGPESFTGEDVAELHLHGGRAVVDAILADLGRRPGLRIAEPGEFTRRAFLNGKMDLTGAEALADLIAAETEAQRRFALDNASGRQSLLYDGWRERLVMARAMVEAELDFADEADVAAAGAFDVRLDLAALRREIEEHVAGFHRAEIVQQGYKVVLIGAPNAGKSSLLNALARREVAIVTEEAGTTRDLIEVALDLGGVKVLLTDTAGIRTASGMVEKIGVERALECAAAADLVLKIVDLTGAAPDIEFDADVPCLTVGTKADLHQNRTKTHFHHAVSSVTGAGLDSLAERLQALALASLGDAGDVLPSRHRHVELLRACSAHLFRALDTRDGNDLMAEELRLAGEALGRITGAVDVEDILDRIFARFCIGK